MPGVYRQGCSCQLCLEAAHLTSFALTFQEFSIIFCWYSSKDRENSASANTFAFAQFSRDLMPTSKRLIVHSGNSVTQQQFSSKRNQLVKMTPAKNRRHHLMTTVCKIYCAAVNDSKQTWKQKAHMEHCHHPRVC